MADEKQAEPTFQDWVAALSQNQPKGEPWNDRGFDAFPALQTAYGHELKVTESSAASDAYLWIRAARDQETGERHGFTDGAAEEASIHIQADQAALFAMQVLSAVWDHYQGRPEMPPET